MSLKSPMFHAHLAARSLCTASVLVLMAAASPGAPQHWGSGYPYLTVIGAGQGTPGLVAYEPPLRAKHAAWPSRWVDRSGNLKGLLPGGAAIGDFWPNGFGTERLVALVKDGSGISARTLEAPQMFSTRPWKVGGTSRLPIASVVSVTAGDVLGRKADQLIVLTRNGQGLGLAVFLPGSSPAGAWSLEQTVPLAPLAGRFAGMACGNFWGEKKDYIALATEQNLATTLAFYALEDGRLKRITTDASRDLPRLARNGLVAADYVKDGFDTLTLLPADPKAPFQIRVAPLKSPKDTPSQGPVYNGKAMSRQWMPGAGRASSKVTMTGRLPGSTPPLALAAGRVFGYVNSSLSTAVRNSHKYDARPDAEIAFTHRFPTPSLFAGAPFYGWPSKGETMGYEIALKNNGQTAIPAGSATLKVWLNTPERNADTAAPTGRKPDFVIPVKEALPAFDPLNPQYVRYKVTTTWPYDLIPCGPGAEWKKVNLEQVGERWLIVQLDCAGDGNLRNNRYEAALSGHTYHPIFAENANLANRIPTVEGDPCSLEYLSRKMADGIQCVWERSGTTTNEDVLQRVFFDGYEVGFPDHEKTEEARLAAWKRVQDKFEGWREIDIWWGENQSWEKFDWSYAAELHESGHLFHPLGDLYGLWVFPVWTSAAKMADGTPVQMMTHAWGPDLFAEGYAMISVPGCEMMKRTLLGTRGGGIERWWTLASDRIAIRVLDRDGKPVPNAEVTAWRYQDSRPSGSGRTGSDGVWDMTYLLGPPTVDKFGRKHYYHEPETGLTDAISQIFTVKIGDYQDSAIWGTENTAANGRHSMLYHSFINEKGWTWDIRTNYKAGAPAPSFTANAAVQGSKVQIGLAGGSAARYRLYRRWEPSYIRNLIGEYDSPDGSLKVVQDLAAPDSREGGRVRAIYEVTEVRGGRESLPRVLTVTGLSNARGVTAQADGSLLVTTNSGRANPFCVLTDGVTTRELFYHFRFGHTATKVAPSRITPGRYYATIASSDMGDQDHRFDVVEPLSETRVGYDIRNEIGYFDAKSATPAAPWSITMRNAAEAARFHPGDLIEEPRPTRVTRVQGDTIFTDGPAFAPGAATYRFRGLRLAGRPGSNAEARELMNARGLDVLTVAAREYIAIADTGNGRIVVWDDDTGYVTRWEAPDAHPAAVATHPTEPGSFFALDRRSEGRSQLYLFSFDGQKLTVASGYPVALEVGDASSASEMGLAAAVAGDATVVLAVTDARRNRVLELRPSGEGKWETAAEYTKPIDTFAGPATLSGPTDVAWTGTADGIKLYALDGGNRLVRLRQAPSTYNEMEVKAQ